jgi:hypothetical protein
MELRTAGAAHPSGENIINCNSNSIALQLKSESKGVWKF